MLINWRSNYEWFYCNIMKKTSNQHVHKHLTYEQEHTDVLFTPKTNQLVTMKKKSKHSNIKYLTKTPNPKINQLN